MAPTTEQKSPIKIIYEDEYLVVVNKPHGLLMHRSPIAKDAKRFLLQEVRNLLNQHIFLVHRLDRKTAGAVVLAKNKEVQSKLSDLFRERKIKKIYHALVRGWTDDNQTIDYPLINEKGVSQEAITHMKIIARYELDMPFGKHSTSRYSLVELQPETGRMHQLRKHMAHIFHPIIGDRPHGCNKQNRLWKEKWGMDTMLLHARSLEFVHPMSGEAFSTQAEYYVKFSKALAIINDI